MKIQLIIVKYSYIKLSKVSGYCFCYVVVRVILLLLLVCFFKKLKSTKKKINLNWQLWEFPDSLNFYHIQAKVKRWQFTESCREKRRRRRTSKQSDFPLKSSSSSFSSSSGVKKMNYKLSNFTFFGLLFLISGQVFDVSFCCVVAFWLVYRHQTFWSGQKRRKNYLSSFTKSYSGNFFFMVIFFLIWRFSGLT